MNEQLQADAAGLRSLIDHLGPAIYVALLEPEGSLLLVNQPALQVSGLRAEDLVGRRMFETEPFTYAPAVAERAREAVARAAAGEPQRYDMDLRLAEDRFITVDLALEPIRDAVGKVKWIVASCHDVTDRVRAERLASVGTLAGSIAHDLNNMLAPIVMSIDLLRENAASDDDRELLDTMANSVQRGADMVRELLAHTRNSQPR